MVSDNVCFTLKFSEISKNGLYAGPESSDVFRGISNMINLLFKTREKMSFNL